MNKLESKAYTRINTIIDIRAKSELRHLQFQFKQQCAIWEEFIESKRYINPFDDENEAILERIKYLNYLMRFGKEKFKALGL